MAEHTSRVGQRADRTVATDEPHDDYSMYDPWTGEYIVERDDNGKIISGLPILSSTEIGNVVEKSVKAYTVICSQCSIPAEYNPKNEPECPECGMICRGKHTSHPPVIRDSKAAGRVDSS